MVLFSPFGISKSLLLSAWTFCKISLFAFYGRKKIIQILNYMSVSSSQQKVNLLN